MRTHRKSYFRTVLAALGTSAASISLAAYGFVGGRILLADLTLFEFPLLRWALVTGFAVLGLVCLLVAAGGLFALHEDAKEASRSPVRAVQGSGDEGH